MDPKMIEMNNLRVLNDYLNQTIDVLVRQPRLGQPSFASFSPFSGAQGTPGPIGTDTVWGPWQGTPAYSPFGPQPAYSSFGPQSPFNGLPLYGASFNPVDPFLAHRGFGTPSFAPTYGPSFAPTYGQSFAPTYGQSFAPMYGQSFAPSFASWQHPWGPMVEATRQAHINQALAAKQSVLEAMCRACGIPV